MYVLVRKDLSNSYRDVQAIHAVVQYALEYTEEFKKWDNGYIVMLGVRNLIDLRQWVSKLQKNKVLFSVFKEPDLDFQETSISCYNSGTVFKNLKIA
jgi:hypothetical protein